MKNIIEIKPKRPKVVSPSDPIKSSSASPDNKVADRKISSPKQISTGESKGQNLASSLPAKPSADVTSGSLLGLSYDNSDDDE